MRIKRSVLVTMYPHGKVLSGREPHDGVSDVLH
jgi:hypothetical protein